MKVDLQPGKTALLAAAYLVVTCVLLLFPISRIVHAEASAVVAGFAFFITGLTANGNISASGWRREMGFSLAASIIPLIALSISTLFVLDCGCTAFKEGLLIYLLFVLPSVILAGTLIRFLNSTSVKRPKLFFVLAGVALAIVPVLVTLKFYPQFFVYNHVFGGVLGPVYDEQLYVRSGLVWFRAVTLLWAGVLFYLSNRQRRRAVVLAAILLGIYLFGGSLGIHGSSLRIARTLGTTLETPNFLIHYSRGNERTPPEVLAAYMEYHYARLLSVTGEAPADPVEVFLYPSSRTKGKLTGAGTTSVAPVWLPRPQIHMLASELGRSFDHELAHVFSREFGGAITKASSRIGLVEGFAVAMEAPDGLPSVDSQVRVILQDSSASERYTTGSLEDIIASPAFWLNRGPVAYSLSGSFVKWLIQQYGFQKFALIYGGKTFYEVYQRDVDSLIRDWRLFINNTEADPVALSLGEARFSIPSLFEKRCPHSIPRETAAYRRALEALRSDDYEKGLEELQTSLELNPAYQAPLQTLLHLFLRSDSVDEALGIDVPDDSVSGPGLLIARGDLMVAAGFPDSARVLYELAETRVPRYAQTSRKLITMRMRLASESNVDSNVFAAGWQPDIETDSTKGVIYTVRAFQGSLSDRSHATGNLLKALEEAGESEMALIHGQLSVYFFWEGDFEQSASHARLASELYLEDLNLHLAEYYDYIAELSNWALSKRIQPREHERD